MPADWQLPTGISRSLWEFAADDQIASDEAAHLAGSPLLEFDHQLISRWFSPPARLLDLGCGTGRSLVHFAELGFTCTGVDVSQPSLIVARKQFTSPHSSCTLLRANLCELNCLADESFDVAMLLFGTLGMVCDPAARRQLLLHARRLLKPPGTLALHVHSLWPHLFLPAGRSWLLRDLAKRALGHRTAGDTWHSYRGIPQIYHHVFSAREIRRLLDSCGFSIRDMLPLRTDAAAAGDLVERRPPVHLRCTGWLIRAQKQPGRPVNDRQGQ